MTKEKTLLNLSIRTTMTVTTDDLEIYADPTLTFTSVGRVNDKLHRELAAWSTAGYPAQQTVEFIPRLFMSMSINGDTHPLATGDDVQELRQAVGDEFLANLVESFWDYEYNYFKKKRSVSVSLSPESGTGNGSEPTT
jgi:hypothetical protein